MFFGKKKTTKDDFHLCEGIRISENLYDIKENRIWTLLLKGFTV